MKHTSKISNAILAVLVAVVLVIVNSSWALAEGTWSSKTPMPAARAYAAAAVINGILYVAGGHDGVTGGTTTLQAYNPATDTWSTLAPMPGRRYQGNGAGVINGELYVAGGWNYPDSGLPQSQLFVYNPGTNSWSSKASMPQVVLYGSAGGASGVINGKLYVTTPYNGYSGTYKFLHVYDPVTNTWSQLASSPNAHGGPAFGVINNKLYVAGGADDSGAHAKLDVYDPATNTWTTKAPMPAAGGVFASEVFNGKLYVIGGSISGAASNTVYVYDPATDTWTTETSMTTARSGAAAGVINGVLYVVGGSNATGTLATVEALTLGIDVLRSLTTGGTSGLGYDAKVLAPSAGYYFNAYAVDETGRLYVWVHGPDYSGGPYPSPVRVYPSVDSYFSNPTSGFTEGTLPTGNNVGNSLTYRNGFLYVSGEKIWKINASTFQAQVWDNNPPHTGWYYTGSTITEKNPVPIAADANFIYVWNGSTIELRDPDTAAIVRTIPAPISPGNSNTWIVAGSHIYLANHLVSFSPPMAFVYQIRISDGTVTAINNLFPGEAGYWVQAHYDRFANRLIVQSAPIGTGTSWGGNGFTYLWNNALPTFTPLTSTITASAGTNGSISPSGAVAVNYGASQSFTITPNTGYHIADVLVDNSSVGAVSSYTFTNVTANHTIAATFAINTYTITASAGANGSISPSGAVSVNYGASQSFTITPNTGYHIADVLVDNSSVGAVATYTFTNVTTNHTIVASFIAVNKIGAGFSTHWEYSPTGDNFTNNQVTGYKNWHADLSNLDDATGQALIGLGLSLDSNLAFDLVYPAPQQTGPPTYQWSFGDVPQGSGANIVVGSKSPDKFSVTFTPGFDASRSVSQTVFTAEATQTVTVTLTPRQNTEGLSIHIRTREDALVNAVITSPTSNESIYLSPDGRLLMIRPTGLLLNTPWTITATIQVTPKVARVEYTPFVIIWHEEKVAYGTVTGSSVSRPAGESLDGVGTWAWSAQGSYGWDWQETLRRAVTWHMHSREIISNQAPFALFSYSPAEPKVNQKVTFNASTSYDPDGTIVSYSWEFGDGGIGTGVIVEHTYASANQYSVILTVTDNAGATGAKTTTVTVAQAVTTPSTTAGRRSLPDPSTLAMVGSGLAAGLFYIGLSGLRRRLSRS